MEQLSLRSRESGDGIRPEDCEHWSGYGYIHPPVYPEQEQLKPGEFWCRNCRSVVPDPVIAHDKWVRSQPCLRGPEGCKGAVGERASFSGTGLMIYECEWHMDESYRRDQELRQRYPVLAPSDFDPMDAGEYWDSDY